MKKLIRKHLGGGTADKQDKPILSYIGDMFRFPINHNPAVWVADGIHRAAVCTGSEPVRSAASVITSALTLPQAIGNQINAAITNFAPSWTAEKAINPRNTVTVDKTNHLARYYDAEGRQVAAVPAGTGLVSGAKHSSGDNKSPSGTYNLGKAEATKNKKGGHWSFGPWYFRTDHRNDTGEASAVGLHGTGFPLWLGSNVSHGCIRTPNGFVQKLHDVGGARKIILYEKNGNKLIKKKE